MGSKLRNVTWLLCGAGILALNSGCGGDTGDDDSSPGETPDTAAYDAADMVRGGQLYDTWWKVEGAKSSAAPSSDNPGYAMTEGTQTGSTTWRCKECHGWDYKGDEGAYATGSHYSGTEGVMEAAVDPADEVFEFVHAGIDGTAMVSFADYLSDSDIWDLVKFVKEGLIDDATYIDATGVPISADIANGEALFAGTCAFCHGDDGTELNFGDDTEPEYVGTVASDNAWEFMHKVRFAQPGTDMPSAIDNGWSSEDVRDVLSFAQTLPIE